MCGKERQYSCKREVSTLPGLGYTKFVINAALQRPRNAKMTLKDVVCFLPSALLCVEKNGNILAENFNFNTEARILNDCYSNHFGQRIFSLNLLNNGYKGSHPVRKVQFF